MYWLIPLALICCCGVGGYAWKRKHTNQAESQAEKEAADKLPASNPIFDLEQAALGLASVRPAPYSIPPSVQEDQNSQDVAAPAPAPAREDPEHIVVEVQEESEIKEERQLNNSLSII